MKGSYLVRIGIATAIAGLIVGCGGGDEGLTQAKLTPKDVDTLGSNAAKMLPGCEYNSANVAFVQMDDRMLNMYQHLDKQIKTLKVSKPLARVINKIEDGSCGGKKLTHGSHNNGQEDLTITYNDYCEGDAMKQTVINGIVSM